jgi:hypothetical protein
MGVGGGGGALLAVTEDAALVLHPGGDAAPAVVSRPLALLDVLAVGWGALAVGFLPDDARHVIGCQLRP